MSSIGTLYTVPGFAAGQRILAVAELAGIKIDIAQNYTHFQDNKKPEYLAKFASGKIPALETKEGFTLFESSTIMRYIASLAPNSKLLGSNPKEAILIDQWMTFFDTELVFLGTLFYVMYEHHMPYNEQTDHIIRDRQEKAYGKLENYLSTRKFFVGDSITVADIHIASVLTAALKTTFDAPLRAKYPHLIRHFKSIVNEPKIKPILGEIIYVEKAVQYVPKAEEK